MKVLVTGGAGYIGSTVCAALKENGHVPIILDSLVTGRKEFTSSFIFYQGDIADKNLLIKIFQENPEINCAIHCAALIVVPESVERPHDYYKENVAKSMEFFSNLNSVGCKKIVFSSSAAIYDTVPDFMVTENSPLKPSSPYSRTKYMMEMILEDYSNAYGIQGLALRYFNPIGADPKMRSGIHLKNPTHVLGKLVDVAVGKLPHFELTGVDWPTRDGSGIRDYIHVWDLAQAHVKAVEEFDNAFAKSGTGKPYLVVNLGTGKGVTVKELVAAFERVYEKPIPKKEAPPRPGDVAGSFANANTAKHLLGWIAQKSIDEGIRDALTWAGKRKSVLGYP